MIRYISHKEIDRSQWDALINEAPNGLIYALSWYLDIVSPGWAAFVKEERGRYVTVLPLPVRRKFGMRYLKQPAFAQQLGLFYLETPESTDWQQIAQLLKKHFQFVTQYAFNTSNTDLLLAECPELTGVVFTTYYLALQPAYPQLLANYKSNRRWRLNQARRRGIYLELTTDIDLLIRIFAENTAQKIRGVIGEAYEYKLLRALYAAASQRGMAHMWQARISTGEVGAIGLIFRFKDQFTYIFNASTLAGKEAGAISILLDNIFKSYAGQDLCFDFEAPEVANIASFYSSFGSKKAPFVAVTANRLPWPVRQIKAARMALYQRFMPQSAVNGA